MAFCPTICSEATVEFLKDTKEFRLSCPANEDVSYKWWFRSSTEKDVMNPPSDSVNTERELKVKGGDPTETNGYYFCVMKHSVSNDIAVSQLISLPSGVKYPNMTREDPGVLSPSRSESLTTSAEPSLPGSAGSLTRQSRAKKAKKEVTRQNCSSSTAAKDPFRKAILREEASRIDAQIFYKLFKEISTGDYAQEDPLVSEESVEEFKAAMDEGKLFHCLNGLFPELLVDPQRPIKRTSGLGNEENKIDVAVVLKEKNKKIVVLLEEEKKETAVSGSGLAQLHREYELLWNEDLPLANVRRGSFPCLGLEIYPGKAVLHGFVMCDDRILHSKLAEIRDFKTDAVKTFLRRLRGGVLALKQEWEKFNYKMPSLLSPQFVPDSFDAYRGLSCGKLLDKLASNAAFRCRISTHNEEEFAIKFVWGHDGKYGSDVHKALVSAQLAPQYLYEGKVPFLESRPTLYVVMEAVPDSWRSLESWLKSSDDAFPPGEAIIANLQRVINVLHKDGLIHGDFRPSNILVNANGDVKIVDFDWSAKASENRCYPKRLNGNIVWPALPESSLEEVHDQFFFASIKTRIRERQEQQERQEEQEVQ